MPYARHKLIGDLHISPAALSTRDERVDFADFGMGAPSLWKDGKLTPQLGS